MNSIIDSGSGLLADVGLKILSINKVSQRLSPSTVHDLYSYFMPRIKWENGEYKPLDEDPLQLYYANPADIIFQSVKTPKKYFGFTTDMSLRANQCIDQNPVFESIHNHFLKGVPWKDTSYPNTHPNYMDNGIRYDSIRSLWKAIKYDGYRSQRELLQENPSMVWEEHNDGGHPIINEVMINIGENGELLWRSRGQHRLAIAKALNIDEIPVMVGVHHEDAPPADLSLVP